MPFDPSAHLMKIPQKAKKDAHGNWLPRTYADYLEVKYRLVWFREKCPHGRISTKFIHLNWQEGLAVAVAVVLDGEGGKATATGTETRLGFEDFVEKAETRAIGRALAMLGFGTQFTGEELSESGHLADSEVEPALAHETQDVRIPPADQTPARPRPLANKGGHVSASKLKEVARANTRQIQEAHEVLGQKPIEALNHDEAYDACLACLATLADTDAPMRLQYLTAAFGAGIDSDVKLYQLGKSALQRGLQRLQDLIISGPQSPQEQTSQQSSMNGQASNDRATTRQPGASGLYPYTNGDEADQEKLRTIAWQVGPEAASDLEGDLFRLRGKPIPQGQYELVRDRLIKRMDPTKGPADDLDAPPEKESL